jgi:hypothetical protein
MEFWRRRARAGDCYELNREFANIVAVPDVKTRFQQLGVETGHAAGGSRRTFASKSTSGTKSSGKEHPDRMSRAARRFHVGHPDRPQPRTIAVVTINRPQRKNACDMAAWTDMLRRSQIYRKIPACGSQYSPDDNGFTATTSIRASGLIIAVSRRKHQCTRHCRMRLSQSLPRFAAYASAAVDLAMCDFRRGRNARVACPLPNSGLFIRRYNCGGLPH